MRPIYFFMSLMCPIRESTNKSRQWKEVLHELGVKEKPILPVLNKIDLKTAQSQWGRLSSQLGRAIPVSALTGEGLDALRDELADFLRNRSMQVDLRIPASDGRLLASIRSSGKILSAKYGDDGFVRVEARIPGRLYGHCKEFLVERVDPKQDKGS